MNNVQEQDLIREILFNFLKDLPPHFDASITSVEEAYTLIDIFMKKYGWKDEKYEMWLTSNQLNNIAESLHETQKKIWDKVEVDKKFDL